ncbi:MAG: hypothetical protein R3A78_11110 [Polyangiales bacterium]|nr:hypothetical protein [Myxococcales bacterium]
MRTLGRVVVTLLAVGAWAAPVRAGNDDEILNGSQAALSAGAVTAVTNDGAALIYNPAGLASARHSVLEGSASAFMVRHYSAPKLIADVSGASDDGSFLEVVSAPSAITWVTPLGPRLSLGLGAFVTRARNLNVNAFLDTVTPSGERAQWLVTLSDTSSLYHAGVGIGVVALPNLRLGVTLFGLYQGAGASFASAGGAVSSDAMGANSGFRAESSRSVGDYFGVRLAAGAQWDVVPELTLGVAVLTPGFILAASEDVAAFAGTGRAQGAGMGGPDSFAATHHRDLSFGFDLFEPFRLRVGAVYRFDEHWISLDGDIQSGLPGSTFATQRTFVWNARVGAHVAIERDFWLGAGLFTDLDAQPGTTRVGGSDVDFVGGTLGIGWSNVRKLAEDEDEDAIAFSTTISLRYAFGFGETGGILVDGASFVDERPVDVAVQEFGIYLGSGLHY